MSDSPPFTQNMNESESFPERSLFYRCFEGIFSCFKSSGVFPLEEELFLPAKKKEHKNRKTLVLDLDETLVHTVFDNDPGADFVLEVQCAEKVLTVSVMKRPGVEMFLDFCGDLFEVVIFTASLPEYANPIIDRIDKTGKVHHRLFRHECTETECGFVKDLARINRNIGDIIIVDNSPLSYSFQKENALPIKSWFSDPNDMELPRIVSVLKKLTKCKDVRKKYKKIKMECIRTDRGDLNKTVDYSVRRKKSQLIFS